jgi:predicted O-methyltransferase YrrM
MNFYQQAKDEGITIIEKLLEPRTLNVMREIMLEKDYAGSSDFQSLGIMYSLTTLTRSSKVLEIGTHLGFSGLYFLDAISKCTKNQEKLFVTIDPHFEHQKKAGNFFDKAGYKNSYKLITDSSLSEEAFELSSKDRFYDVLYIDSLHTYDQMYNELRNYTDLVKTGGLIFCHDSSVSAIEYDTTKKGGVRNAIKDFISKYNQIQPLFLDSQNGWNPVGLFVGIKLY